MSFAKGKESSGSFFTGDDTLLSITCAIGVLACRQSLSQTVGLNIVGEGMVAV